MRKRTRSFVFGLLGVLLVIAIPIGMTEAASGDLDSNFGSGGRVTTGFTGVTDEAHAIVVQPDGKIIAAGWTSYGPGLNFALTRYNPDGSLDPSFGSGGKVSTPFAGDLAFGNAVALQSDGKIVVAGWTLEADIALARYNADGSLDIGFGVGGTVTTDLGSLEQARAVAIQPDGWIVVVGVSELHSVVVRYTSSGSLDPGFGSGGVVSVDFATPWNSQGRALALQSDGKIVIAGTAATGTVGSDLSFDFALARLNSDGSFDSTFGSDGKVTTSFGPAMDDHAMAIGIQPDGKIVAAGESLPQGGSATGPDFALARYNADGSLDVGFGTGGVVITDFSLTDDRARAIALQANGKIVAAGFTGVFGFPASNTDFALARYNANGSLDNSFGSGGKVKTDFGGGNDEAGGIALQPDGKIVAVGFTSFALSGGDVKFALARYLGDPATIPVGGGLGVGSFTAPAPVPLTLQLNVTNSRGDAFSAIRAEWLVLTATVGGVQLPIYVLTSDWRIFDVGAVTDFNAVTYSFSHSSDVATIASLAMSSLGLGPGDIFMYGYAYTTSDVSKVVLDNVVILNVK